MPNATPLDVEPPLRTETPTSIKSLSDTSSTTADGPNTPVEEDTTPEVIDPNGDLILTVQPENDRTPRAFQVNSMLICRASPKWTELLAANDTSLPDAIMKRMTIKDNNVDSVERALNIIHLNVEKVPLRLTFQQLVECVEMMRRHKLEAVLHEYVKNWYRPFVSKLLDPGYEMWISIAHELGWSKVCDAVARNIYLSMRVVDGEYWVGDRNLSKTRMCPGILDDLIKHRRTHYNLLMEICYGAIKFYSATEPSCLYNEDADKCMSTALGSLLRGLKQLDLWPERPDVDDFKGDIFSLKSNLETIVVSGHHHATFYKCTDNDEDWFPYTLRQYSEKMDFVGIEHKHDDILRCLQSDEPCIWQSQAIKQYDFEDRDFGLPRALVGLDSDSDSDYDTEDSDLISQPEEEYSELSGNEDDFSDDND